MKSLIRRLSKVGDSSQYTHLDDSAAPPKSARGLTRWRAAAAKVVRRSTASLPAGHVPVYVGEEMERFVVSAELLNHPIFVGLLNESADEYGYGQKGALRILCQVMVFERLLEALRLGGGDAPPDLLLSV